MGLANSNLKEDTEYNNKIIFLKYYECKDYTPLHSDDNAMSFEGRIREITPVSILFLYKPKNEIGSYWWVLDHRYYKNVKLGSNINTLDEKNYTYLAIPNGVICYAGLTKEHKEDSLFLLGEKQQFYIPKDVQSALTPLSDRFISRLKSRESEKKYIKDILPILKIQSKYIEEYKKKLKNYNDVSLVNKLDLGLLCIYSMTSRTYNNLNLQNLILELEHLREKMLIGIRETEGLIKEEIITMLKSLVKFQEIIVANVNNNTDWGSNFEDILEICKVRDNPKLGNLFHQCDQNFKNLFLKGEVLSSVENTEHIIHRRKSDGYLIKVKIIKDYGDNNFIAEFY